MTVSADNQPRFLDEPAPVTAPSAPPAMEAPAPQPLRPALLEPAADTPLAVRPAWAPVALATAPARAGNGFWVTVGLLTAIGSWAGFAALSWFATVLSDPTPLGIAGAVGVGGGLAVAVWGLAREWRDYRRLRTVDAVRAVLADQDAPLPAVRAAALDWFGRVTDRVPDASAVRQALQDAGSAPELHAILTARITEPLAAAARRIGQDAAVEGAALVAISPHASWDALIAAWKGVLVIRKVALVYGLRPGPMVTMALMRKVAWTAAGTAGVDLLSQTLADQVLSSLPVARHVIAAVPGGGVAALRLYRLATITARACSPV